MIWFLAATCVALCTGALLFAAWSVRHLSEQTRKMMALTKLMTDVVLAKHDPEAHSLMRFNEIVEASKARHATDAGPKEEVRMMY